MGRLQKIILGQGAWRTNGRLKVGEKPKAKSAPVSNSFATVRHPAIAL
jgi:hypothetical protein